MGGGSLSDQQLKEFDEYLSNSGVKQPAAQDEVTDEVEQPEPAPAPTLEPVPEVEPEAPIVQPAPEPTPEPIIKPTPTPTPVPEPVPEVEPEALAPAPEPIQELEPEAPIVEESYLDDIIALHEQKSYDILDLLDKIDAKSHKDIVADLVDEMQYQKGVIRREREQADNLKQLFKLAADAAK